MNRLLLTTGVLNIMFGCLNIYTGWIFEHGIIICFLGGAMVGLGIGMVVSETVL